jgi:predicted Rossmann-fold nucleotide-binding protein
MAHTNMAIDPSSYDPSKLFDYSGTQHKNIAVYCWSRTERGTAWWNEADKLGKLAAENGYSIISGGYCGSMEAVSEGARKVVDAMERDGIEDRPEVVGIVVNGQFPDRALSGNPFLTKSVDAPNFPRRVELLASQSRYYVILPGTLGTLQELSTVWTLSYIHPSGLPKPVILAFRDPWEKVVASVTELLNIPQNVTDLVKFVDNADDCMRVILEDAAAQQAQ